MKKLLLKCITLVVLIITILIAIRIFKQNESKLKKEGIKKPTIQQDTNLLDVISIFPNRHTKVFFEKIEKYNSKNKLIQQAQNQKIETFKKQKKEDRKLLDSGVFSNLTKNTINTKMNRDNIYDVIKTKINSFMKENIEIPSLKVRIEDIYAELMDDPNSDTYGTLNEYKFKNYEVVFTKINDSSGDGFEIKWVLYSK